MKKGTCELCSKSARLHCESDQATLCWECDEKVHGANFLVAKHCRSLLCHVCQTTTPWKACGPKLFPTMSVCESCSNNRNSRIEQKEINQPQMRNNLDNEEIKNGVSDETESDNNDGNQEYSSDDDDDYEEYDDVEYEDAEDDDDDDDDGENQVVPWVETS
ncbi:hypothetical protein LIER_05533 [Lithospermum erythrorhizon]|uniref:B box-type domain-containing protein n=1 Tax=Lithospermum erythrorhizon TaxID=34254 RepID=A0AAV3P4X9_LITER